MKQKLRTNLRYYRFHANKMANPVVIEWYRYDLDENEEDNIRGFSPEELKKFENYVVQNFINFEGGKSYFIVSEGEEPVEAFYSIFEDERVDTPEYLIIKPETNIAKGAGYAKFMQIELLNADGKSNHFYNLPFGAIGKIQ